MRCSMCDSSILDSENKPMYYLPSPDLLECIPCDYLCSECFY